MRSVLSAASATLALVSLAVGGAVARAQEPDPAAAAHNYKAQPLNLRKEQLGTAAYTDAARAKMRAGDCLGALQSFDAALESSNQDPTLYRDRGLCHEKLGHPYPAIDDYRVYLTDVPDAADAERIRGRLSRLEEETSGRGPVANANDDTDVPPVTEGAAPEGDGSTTPAASASAPTSPAPPHDKASSPDLDDDPLDTPLRRGKGFALAPFLSVHKWFFSGASFGDGETWSEAVGAQLRYSFGGVVAVFAEVGYEHFNSSTSADEYTIAGLTSQVALEFRVPLDAAYDNQLILAPGFGYQHIAFAPTNPEVPSIATNAIVPRFRFGYRHLLEAAAAVDFSIDVGLAKWFVPSSDTGGTGLDIPTTALVAANVELLWAL